MLLPSVWSHELGGALCLLASIFSLPIAGLDLLCLLLLARNSQRDLLQALKPVHHSGLRGLFLRRSALIKLLQYVLGLLARVTH